MYEKIKRSLEQGKNQLFFAVANLHGVEKLKQLTIDKFQNTVSFKW